jgi:hypothetical protein
MLANGLKERFLRTRKDGALMFSPRGDSSHVLGGLPLIALLAQTLEVVPVPLRAPHSDRRDVIEHVGVSVVIAGHRLSAVSAQPELFLVDEATHAVPGGALLVPVRL